MNFLIFLAVSLFLPLVIFLHHHNKKISKPSTVHLPPGPPGIPVIGNLHQLDFSVLHKSLWQISQKYGPLMSLKLGSVQTLVVSSPRMAEEVLKIQDSAFCSRPKLAALQMLSYNGLDIGFAGYSKEWRERRKICVHHLLSAKRIQQFRSIREDEACKMIQKIKKDVEFGRATNLSETILSITSSMICRVAFGKSLDDGSKERRRFDGLLHEIQAMFMGFFFRDYFPSLGWIIDHLTGMNSRLERTFRNFDSFYQEIIDEHLDRNRPKSMDGDIIDLLLQMQRDGSNSINTTMDHIKAISMNIFLAGTDPTSITLVWAMTALIKNPKILKKVQAEIREVMGIKEPLDEDDIEKLPYLKATVKETFRMFMTEPLLFPRETLSKCTIDGYEIPQGTLVYVNAWAIARDPKAWDNPSEFRPERFLNSKIDVKGKYFQLIPFGSGRRGCPGYSMGLLIVHLLLANLLHSFDWELPQGMKKEDVDTESSPGLAAFKKNALKLRARIPQSIGGFENLCRM